MIKLTLENKYALDMGYKNGKNDVYLPFEYASSHERLEQYEIGYEKGIDERESIIESETTHRIKSEQSC